MSSTYRNKQFCFPDPRRGTLKSDTQWECRGTHTTPGSDHGSGPHSEDAALPVGLEKLLGVGLRGLYSNVRGADIHRSHSGHQWWQGIWRPQGESKTLDSAKLRCKTIGLFQVVLVGCSPIVRSVLADEGGCRCEKPTVYLPDFSSYVVKSLLCPLYTGKWLVQPFCFALRKKKLAEYMYAQWFLALELFQKLEENKINLFLLPLLLIQKDLFASVSLGS